MQRNIDLARFFKHLFIQFFLPLAAIGVFVSVLPDWEPRNHWSVLFIFTFLTIIGAFAPISTFNARLTVNNALFFSGILLYGTWVAVWAAFVELLIVTVLSRSSLKKAMFNCGQILLTLWLVGFLHTAADSAGMPWMVSDLLLIVVYWFVNTSLVAAGISYFFQVKWLDTFTGMVKGGSNTYVMLMIIGGIGARLVAVYGWPSLIPLLAAFIALNIVFRQYFHNMNKLHQKMDEIKTFNHSFLTTMAASIDARDHYTSGHSQRVAHWGREIARAIGMPPDKVDEVYFGGILHDIGKIGIEDHILNKKGKLTPEEYDKIKQHTVIGYEIILQAGMFHELLPAIRSHHERIDGKGYPDGLKGDEIPLMARILAISDAFDAMVADRPYRKGLPVEDALQEIRRGAGTQFDAELAHQFIRVVSQLSREELEKIIQQDNQTQLQEVLH
ncbi:HD-GYP domain-containing protein [Brevibacillus borstelensis]|uniref:HD-GYP domain-containing protein n=1 Tax=Brevibacillus borstelensis TaxID=45462 RepID=UPI0030BE3E45